MLKKFLDKELIKKNLTDFCMFKKPTDRAYWDRFKAPLQDYFEEIHKKYDDHIFSPLTLSLFREFHTHDNRARFEDQYFSRRNALIAYTLEEVVINEGKNLEKIADLVWMILEESTWVIPAHVHLWGDKNESLPNYEHQIIDLFAAETMATLAFVYYLTKDKLDAFLNSTKLTERIKIEVKRRGFDRFLDTHHWWTAFRGERAGNNWNPWCHSNVLIALSVFGADDETKADILYRALKSFDLYFEEYPKDGACDEGPDYWYHSGGTMMLSLYIIKNLTGGTVDVSKEPQLQNLAEYITHVQISESYVVNFADGAAKIPLRLGLLYKFGEMAENETLREFAKFFYQGSKKIPLNITTAELTASLFQAEFLADAPSFEKANFTFAPEHYFESTNVLTARFGKGLFFGAKGGNNNECHNHNDVGTFVVFKDGTPFIVDSGPLRYSALTFKEETRYTIWTNKSEYHNTPTIGGKNQPFGKEYKASDVSFESNEEKFTLSMNLKDAYENKDEIEYFKRTFVGDRTNDTITVTEEYALCADAPVTLNFLTAMPFDFSDGKGVLTAENGVSLTLSIDLSKVNIETEEIVNMEDTHMVNNWGGKLYRTRFTLKDTNKEGKITYTIQ